MTEFNMVNKLKICAELFVLDHNGDYILYLPLKSITAIVNADTIKLLNAIKQGKDIDVDSDIIHKLKELGVFEDAKYPLEDSTYKPTNVTFLPSFECNLKCLYCYSFGGDFATKKLPLITAQKAIDFICLNAIERNKKEIGVGFHGGGEPMLLSNKIFLEKIIEYAKVKARELNLNSHFTVATNGVDIKKFNVAWLKENITRFSISLDGPPDIQNYQRPRRGKNKDSYLEVLNTIKLFEANKIDYSIRSTITKYSVSKMDKIVEHFAKISSQKTFHLEPLFACGRCKTTQLESPSSLEFVKNFTKTLELVKDYGIKIQYSGASINKITDRFCGAAGDNFFITPDSNITTCLEACRESTTESEPFIIGNFNYEANEFEFNHDKIVFLKSRKVTKMESCNDCFCKFSCAGDCLAKVLHANGNLFDTTNNDRCRINIALTELLLKEAIC